MLNPDQRLANLSVLVRLPLVINLPSASSSSREEAQKVLHNQSWASIACFLSSLDPRRLHAGLSCTSNGLLSISNLRNMLNKSINRYILPKPGHNDSGLSSDTNFVQGCNRCPIKGCSTASIFFQHAAFLVSTRVCTNQTKCM
jgi:hypothetical protein